MAENHNSQKQHLKIEKATKLAQALKQNLARRKTALTKNINQDNKENA